MLSSTPPSTTEDHWPNNRSEMLIPWMSAHWALDIAALDLSPSHSIIIMLPSRHRQRSPRYHRTAACPQLPSVPTNVRYNPGPATVEKYPWQPGAPSAPSPKVGQSSEETPSPSSAGQRPTTPEAPQHVWSGLCCQYSTGLIYLAVI